MMVFDANRDPMMVVEVKNKPGKSREWAAKTRRNMLAHESLPKTPYFLLALPDRFFLWKDAGNSPEIIEPTYEIDPTPFLAPYFEKSGLSPENLSRYSFELIVLSWLNELNQIHDNLSDIPKETLGWLVESGLLEAMAGSNVEFEEMA